MNTATHRNVVPFPIKKKPAPMFSADPRHAGLRFPRTSVEAFRGSDYAGWLYHYRRPSLWRRIVMAVRSA